MAKVDGFTTVAKTNKALVSLRILSRKLKKRYGRLPPQSKKK